MSDIGAPGLAGDGNTRPDSSRKAAASLSRSTTCTLIGTRCSTLAFIRSDDIRHTSSLRSISSQVAPLASPDRAAVRTRNVKHNLTAVEARVPPISSSAEPTSSYGSALRCAFTLAIAGNAPSIASPAGLDSTKPYAIAHRKTVLIRWRTRRAVSGRVVQIGVRTEPPAHPHGLPDPRVSHPAAA